MGIILAANGLGGAVSIQIVNRLIYSEGGWRFSYRVIAVILAVVALIVVLVVRNRPEEMGLKPMAAKPNAKKKKAVKRSEDNWEGLSLKEAMRKPYFYVMMVCVFLTGLILQSICGISSAHMKDNGINTDSIATILSLSSLILMASKIGTGICFDRFGLRTTMMICYFCSLVSLTMLALVSNDLMAALYSIFNPFALPLETIMLPLIAKDLFGYHSYSQIMGLVVSVNTLGYATGGPIMNLMYDLTGTYRPTMLVMVGIMVVVAIAMQFVITAAHKCRSTSN
jgi:sugar phosphate permease